MAEIIDRNGRRIRMIFRGHGGRVKELDLPALDAAHRLRRNIPQIIKRTAASGQSAGGYSAKTLCDKAIRKILGLDPVKVEIEFENKKSISLPVPGDLGNFIGDLSSIIISDQYNAAGVKNAVVVDAGANLGVFSLYAYARGAKRVYAFEPVAETHEMLKKNIELNHLERTIIPLNLALGKERAAAKLKYNTRGEGSAMIAGKDATVNKDIRYERVRDIEVAALDGLIDGKVGFIKIDVEGCEEDVLLGARRLIRRYKPVLSFAAYHKRTDKRTLPGTVLGIRNDYRIVLNTFAEHDFYCD